MSPQRCRCGHPEYEHGPALGCWHKLADVIVIIVRCPCPAFTPAAEEAL